MTWSGVVSVAQAAVAGSRRTRHRWSSSCSPPLFVPETLTGMELLEQFRVRAGRMVFVVDEYGVVQGLMTPHDLLEAITGELQPVAQAEAWATQREDGSWLLDGLMPVAELKARLEIRELPEEDRGRYNTLAGLLMSVSGHLPAAGERIDCGDWRSRWSTSTASASTRCWRIPALRRTTTLIDQGARAPWPAPLGGDYKASSSSGCCR